MKFWKIAGGFVLFLFVNLSTAGYTANTGGKVAWLKIYNSNVIYFSLDTMPTDHQCANNYFALDPNLTERQSDRYYSLLLAARTSGATVSVGYDYQNASCVYGGTPVIYAVSM